MSSTLQNIPNDIVYVHGGGGNNSNGGLNTSTNSSNGTNGGLLSIQANGKRISKGRNMGGVKN